MKTSIRMGATALAVLSLFLAACSMGHAPSPLQRGAEETRVESQFLFLIHGDADYVYYDRNHQRHRADEEAFDQTVAVAKKNRGAEVLIFRQLPAGFFRIGKRRYGSFRLYRHGREITRIRYMRSAGEGGLKSEIDLYRRFSRFKSTSHRVFAYFGHEIPVHAAPDLPYSAWNPGFSLDSLALALGAFGSPPGEAEKPFGLLILSSCFGAGDAVAETLSPYGHYLVGSPLELHLSYLDVSALAAPIQKDTSEKHAWAFALGKQVADHSFRKIRDSTQVTVAITLTDLDAGRSLEEAHPHRNVSFYRGGKFGRKSGYSPDDTGLTRR